MSQTTHTGLHAGKRVLEHSGRHHKGKHTPTNLCGNPGEVALSQKDGGNKLADTDDGGVLGPRLSLALRTHPPEPIVADITSTAADLNTWPNPPGARR